MEWIEYGLRLMGERVTLLSVGRIVLEIMLWPPRTPERGRLELLWDQRRRRFLHARKSFTAGPQSRTPGNPQPPPGLVRGILGEDDAPDKYSRIIPGDATSGIARNSYSGRENSKKFAKKTARYKRMQIV
ncbi:hypothetical protein Trydic_g23489 [Trypoxylus dichotomus]